MRKNQLFVAAFAAAFAILLTASAAFAQAFNPARLSGVVTAYKPADCEQAGSITIGGVTLPIAAGTYTTFVDVSPFVDFDGIIKLGLFRSDVWQVLNTARVMDVYVDDKGAIRLMRFTSSPAGTRPIDITGAVTANPGTSITISGVTLPTSAAVSAAVDATKVVRITGTLNAAGALDAATATVSATPYQKLTICGAPTFTRSAGALIGDINPADGAGPITSNVGTTFQTTSFVCDNSVEVMSIQGANQFSVANTPALGGGTGFVFGPSGIPFAPNFSIMKDISKDVNACYELQIDAFGFATTGSKKIGGRGNSISGTLNANVTQGYTGPFPTTRNEAAQRGSILISGTVFTIAAGNTATVETGAVSGAAACVVPNIDPAGETVPFLTGWLAPRRAGQLLNGSRVAAGACP